MIQKERIHFVNDFEVKLTGKCVVYWMEQSMRSEFNYALEYAILRANEMKVPLLVFYALPLSYPQANWRQYQFVLEGLAELVDILAERGIKLVVRVGRVVEMVTDFCFEVEAGLLVTDRGYLNISRKWKNEVNANLSIRMIEVESDVVVPVELVSNKEEFAARTIRPKILKYRDVFLRILKPNKIDFSSDYLKFSGELNLRNIDEIIADLKIDRTVGPGFLRGGRSQAVWYLKEFLTKSGYAEQRNQPTRPALSNMSPYLRHGQISAVEIALRVKDAAQKGVMATIDVEAYLEELIVRRELSINFCYFNKFYNQFKKAIPNWAQVSLNEHISDKRQYVYRREQFESAATHDAIWNACQNEMVKSGKMHGYMRMYWGKKILEWSKTPEDAFDTAIYLNDKYELDGFDPNGYTGVAWCFGKHDRPWGPERPIFGLVRYMNDSGIKRKIKDWKDYVEKWNSMI